MVKSTPTQVNQTPYPSPMTGQPSRWLFQHEVLGQHRADYYYDEKIGYIFARQPHWLEEAYSEAISSLDTGVLARNWANISTITRCLSKNNHHEVANGIDLGAGYGIFVRGMRDVGVDFYWSDKYSPNLLARGFDAKSETYDIAVAFEVLEHLPNPVEFMLDHRKEYKFHTCFFSATCFDERKIPGADWWYWSFESGQHISFFSERSLLWMAKQLDMRLCRINRDVFAFSNLKWAGVDSGLIRKVCKLICNRGYHMLFPRCVRRSLTETDRLILRDKMRASTNDAFDP